ncbi:hypothetical protein B5S33_g2425 [[Candida] boidinii]|nr:hypothetical protein B5S33_g2425 [[Candida] boidinii]
MFGFAKKLVSSIETQASTYLNNESKVKEDETYEFGLRVLSVEKDSIAQKYGFESFFDFIISVNGYEVTSFINFNKYAQKPQSSNPYDIVGDFSQQDINTNNSIDYTNLLGFLSHEVKVSKSDLVFKTWSAKGAITRDITIPNIEFNPSENDQLDEINIANDDENSNANSSYNESTKKFQNSTFKKLSLNLQLTPLSSASHVWHILKVNPNSPAYLAGLLAGSDYIIGSEGGLLITGGEDLLGRVINSVHTKWKLQAAENPNIQPCSIVFYVYNHDYDIVRPVTIYLNDNWGGFGLLGCDVGYGLLHKLPEVIGKYENFPDSSNQGAGKSDLYGSGSITSNTTAATATAADSFGGVASNYNNIDLTPGGVVFDSSSSLPPPSGTTLTTGLSAPNFQSQPVQNLTAQDASNAVPARRLPPKKNIVKQDLSSYFEEETAKSKKLDRNSTTVDASNAVPPPPKFNKNQSNGEQ